MQHAIHNREDQMNKSFGDKLLSKFGEYWLERTVMVLTSFIAGSAVACFLFFLFGHTVMAFCMLIVGIAMMFVFDMIAESDLNKEL